MMELQQARTAMARAADQARVLGTCIARLQGSTITLRTPKAGSAAGGLSPHDKTLVLQLVLGHVAEQLPELMKENPLLRGLPHAGRVESVLGDIVGFSRALSGSNGSRQIEAEQGTSVSLQQRSSSAGGGGGGIPLLNLLTPLPLAAPAAKLPACGQAGSSRGPAPVPVLPAKAGRAAGCGAAGGGEAVLGIAAGGGGGGEDEENCCSWVWARGCKSSRSLFSAPFSSRLDGRPAKG